MTTFTERIFGRSFGRQPEIRDGVRGEALVLQSIASLKPSLVNMDARIVGGWKAWACSIPLLVELPGREPYALSPVRWMWREKFPIAGTALPVTVERSDPSAVRIEWDEVPSIDEWIAGGHPVFTDPESVQRRFDEGWRTYRDAAVKAGSAGVADEVAEAAAAGSGVGTGIDRERVAQLIAEQQAEHAATVPKPVLRRPQIDGASGRIIAVGRPDDDGNAKETWGEVLLSVAAPGSPRYGVRWTGSIPTAKLKLEWWDVPLTIDPDDRSKVKIRWSEASGIEVVAPLLDEWNQRLEAQLSEAPAVGIDRFSGLLATIPDPARRAEAERQLAEGLARASGAQPQPDPLDELARLGERLSAGELTQAEFAAEKKRLLGDM